MEETKIILLTKEELNLILKKIEALKNSLYEQPEIPIKKKFEKFNLDKILFPKNDIDNLTLDRIEDFLEKKKKSLENIPQVVIEIAFEPNLDFILKLKNWFLQKIKKSLILDIKINPKIIGGAKIYYEGKYFDWSLEKRIKNIKNRI